LHHHHFRRLATGWYMIDIELLSIACVAAAFAVMALALVWR
jgi:hypothetical protein